MVKIKPQPFSLQIPIVKSKGTGSKPDLLLMVKDGITKVSCLNEGADLRKIIYQVEWYLDILKDMQWVRNKQRK